MANYKRLSQQEEKSKIFKKRALSAIIKLIQYLCLYAILILLEILFCVVIKKQNIQETMQSFLYSTFLVNGFVLLTEVFLEFILNIKFYVVKLSNLLTNKNNTLLIAILIVMIIVFILDVVMYALLKIDYLERENELIMRLLCIGIAISDIGFAICLNDLKENQETLK